MKNLLIILVLLFCFTYISEAQKCASIRNLELIKKYDITTYNNIMDIENHTASFINSPFFQPLDAQTTVHIPVIVHVLYSNSTQNISDDQIRSQIAVLNEDFNRLNADRTNTPAAFSGVANGAYLDFFLACIDPNGNPTNGITRTQTSVDPFTPTRNSDGTINETATRVKFTSLGGYDAWPRDRYLNIWVCNLASPILGYTQFPGTGTAATDGVVIKYNCFGRIGTLDPTYNKGRTSTHEVGHWLNLIHIWGDDDGLGNQCSGSDFVDDTPNQQIENYGCPSFPHTDNCTTQSPGVMFMDYMDYTDDACMNLYTTGQVNRMRSLFSPGGARECFVSNTSIYRWCNSIMTFTGAPLICSSGTFTVSNPPTGCTVSWANSSNLTISPGAGSTAIFTANGNGSGWVQPTVNSTSCGSVVLPQIIVWVGTPQITNQKVDGSYYSPGKQICPGNHWLDVTPVGQGAGNATWTVPSGIQYIVGNNTLDFTFPSNLSSIAISARSANSCGTSSNANFYLTKKTSGCPNSIAMTLYPNPASDNVTIIINENITLVTPDSTDLATMNINNSQSVESTTYTIRIYNSQSALLSTFVRRGKSFDVPLTNMRNGVYIIEVSDGKNTSRQQLIVKHN